ncbi:MAG TPA: right-handed parallel beta-helix repeat-containing protein [Streptosporangiaceae bacterium]|jgi:hypothetical protein
MTAHGRHGLLARRALAALTAALVGSALTAGGWPALAAARSAAASYTVTTLADAGPGSLRAAITAADSAPTGAPITIGFTVTGVITLASALPAITTPAIIDATTAPGYAAGGPPLVEIDCFGYSGLRFAAGSAGGGLLGVAVVDAGTAAVRLAARSVTIDGDYLGLNLAGGPDGNHNGGLYAGPGSGDDLIGRASAAGATGATGAANVISANGGSGIVLDHSSGDTVAANRIGTDPSGSKAIPNTGDGLEITGGSARDEIGGTDYTGADGQQNNPTGSKGTVPPVFVVPPLGNQISGNGGDGVSIGDGARATSLNGNFVGTTADGDAALGNGGNGVAIGRASGTSLTGCRFVNNPFVYYNVISGNRGNGLDVGSASNTTVQGNFFGIGANNTTTVANGRNGILVTGSSAQTQVGGVIPLGNVSAGNRLNGIAVTGRARGFTTFNTFGGLLAFKGAAPNGRDGLLITSPGGDNLVRTNVFSGNTRNGMELAGRAAGVTVDPDIAGLSTNGMSALPNGGDGLLIRGHAHGNTIGGTLVSVIPQNTFSGNHGYGVAITGHAYGNRVFTSFIGAQILGLKALGNGRGGVLVGGRARGNIIGGIPPRKRGRRKPANLISGNSGPGVRLGRGTAGNLVTGNYIGLDRRGHWLRNSGPPVLNAGRNVVVANRIRPR